MFPYSLNVMKIIKCFTNFFMCEFIDSLSSIKTPRFFTTDDLITSELPTVIEEILTLDNCCRVPMIRNSVFSSLRRSLSCSIHPYIVHGRHLQEKNEANSENLKFAFSVLERTASSNIKAVKKARLQIMSFRSVAQVIN